MPPENISELHAPFKCEFGCPPPRMPADKFLDMEPVPRPMQPPGVDGKYLPFSDCYGKPTPFCALLWIIVLQQRSPLLAPPSAVGDNARSTIKCTVCPHVRAVYTKTKLTSTKCSLDRAGEDALKEFIDTARSSTYVCGDDLGETAPNDSTQLIGCELKGAARPYIRAAETAMPNTGRGTVVQDEAATALKQYAAQFDEQHLS